MIRPWMVYGVVLTVALGASWMHYTAGEEAAEKEGIVLVDATRDDVTKIVYAAPELEVAYELSTDASGPWGWVTVTDKKQKKAKEGETPPPVEPKITAFKAGSAGDKLIEGLAPLYAMRELVGVDDGKIESFGLTSPDTTVTIVTGGRTATLELGGETYGAKDRYVRHRESSKYYVIDDELFKPLKFAATRLPERGLSSFAIEVLDSVTLGKGGKVVEWQQHNKDDRNADWWERIAAAGTGEVDKKDETFANWLEKAMKVKSQSYVQADERPTDLQPSFDLTYRVKGKPDETIRFQTSGEDWYATSEFTHGLVKLTRSAARDAGDEVDDILEGREPPPEEKKPPAMAPPGAEGDEAGNAPPRPPMPGMAPGLPPGMPGMRPPAGKTGPTAPPPPGK
ncbi:MAG: DUF4340 domain-containing protein [Deltaproteobacteria bacterium]|nr:DUF4340 domain-containing protein [Deltaproteobacteria bacterium]